MYRQCVARYELNSEHSKLCQLTPLSQFKSVGPIYITFFKVPRSLVEVCKIEGCRPNLWVAN